jgi:hypothetical protein
LVDLSVSSVNYLRLLLELLSFFIVKYFIYLRYFPIPLSHSFQDKEICCVQLRIQNPPLTIASEVLLQRPGTGLAILFYSLLLFIWSTISDLVCTITASGSWYFKSGVIVHYRAQLFIIAIYMAINII